MVEVKLNAGEFLMRQGDGELHILGSATSAPHHFQPLIDPTSTVLQSSSSAAPLLSPSPSPALPPGARLCLYVNTDGEDMFVLQSGLMAVSVDGNEVAVVKKGGVVGELALLYSEPRAASVEAVSDCTLWSLVSEGPCRTMP